MKTMTAAAAFLLVTVQSVHAAEPVSAMNSWVEGHLASNAGSVAAYLFLFLGGLLASLLPCVYPLYPITASIVKGRAEKASIRWVHPASYYFGLATIYALLGFFAGLSGGAFNTLMRLPMVNLALSFLFLVLALATAGFLTLHFFGGGQVGDKTPGVVGTFVMGAGAGLVSSSCVGPFVVSILIGIASGSISGQALTSAFSAGLKMLAFGMGVGVPFLLVGLIGARLPKGGAWMRHVQRLLLTIA